LVVYIGQKPMGPGFPLPVLSADQQRAADSTAQQVAASLHAKALELMAVYNPNAPVEAAGQGPGEQLGGRPTVSLADVTPGPNGGESINRFAGMYVATPELLRAFGIESTEIPTGADIITARKDLASMTVFDPTSRDGSTKPASRAIVNNVPQHDSEPTALVTERGMRTLGLAAAPGGWLLRAPSTLTRSQITSAQRAAANVGLVVEARSAPTDLAPLRNWSTAAGILVALGVLAMTVGLIRSESGRDLSTLTATGASSRTRRAITGATTGALAVLGALLGTAGAYAALIAWHRSDLHPLTEVPWTNLVLILVALPALATAVGWLLAGREPATANRQPIE
jgi:putative ABC transport system permease protein